MHEGFGSHTENEDSFRVVHLSELGIEFDKKGVLQLKEEKFQKALETDFEGIAEVISGERGFVTQLKTVMDGFSNVQGGVMVAREKGLQSRIRQIDDSIANKQRTIEKKTESLTNQFSRLQGSLSDLQRQQNYLSATLGGAGGNPVSQLLGG
jgi:flagellar hook-associated protein 2